MSLTFDGVRGEQKDRADDYALATAGTLWAADKHWRGVAPFRFTDHQHQSGMLRHVLDEIHTPLLLYVEQDTPLVCDEPIDWQACADLILSGESNLVRFHHEAHIPDVHAHMMHGTDGVFTRTSQWSQRPHLASVAFYRRILASHFTTESKCFIEDRMHGVCDNAYRQDGMNGWRQYAMHVYTPDGENIKRSYHLDGRAGAPKWDETQVY